MRGENVPVIFGLKLRQLREERGLALKELSGLSGLSASYLNEIEKGKKYPKTDKILQLAEALDVPYDQMVSLKLSKNLGPLGSMLDSPIIQALPLQMFGLTPRDIIDLISRAPKEVSALLRTLGDIASSYDMHVEHFLYAMLRSYQETHENYFEEIETSVLRFAESHHWSADAPLSAEHLSQVLTNEMNIAVEDLSLEAYPDLAGFRSIWVPGPPPRLLINPNLSEEQKAFQLGREIGYQDIGLKERGVTSSRAEVESFAQVLNDFKASYYAGALMIREPELLEDLKTFFAKSAWEPEAFLAMMNRYRVSPEMFMYRLTQLVPKHFGIKSLHFLRINHDTGSNRFDVTKHLNMGGPLFHAEIGLNEHYCRRWQAVSLLTDLAGQQAKGTAAPPLIAAQRTRFLNNETDYFFITLARPLALTPGTNTSVTLGLRMDRRLPAKVAFCEDPSIESASINETCERCGFSESECNLRSASATQFAERQRLETRKEALNRLLAEAKGA